VGSSPKRGRGTREPATARTRVRYRRTNVDIVRQSRRAASRRLNPNGDSWVGIAAQRRRVCGRLDRSRRRRRRFRTRIRFSGDVRRVEMTSCQHASRACSSAGCDDIQRSGDLDDTMSCFAPPPNGRHALAAAETVQKPSSRCPSKRAGKEDRQDCLSHLTGKDSRKAGGRDCRVTSPLQESLSKKRRSQGVCAKERAYSRTGGTTSSRRPF